MLNFNLNAEALNEEQAPSDAYHRVIQPSLTVIVTVEYETVYVETTKLAPIPIPHGLLSDVFY